jgi:hypothetical protein
MSGIAPEGQPVAIDFTDLAQLRRFVEQLVPLVRLDPKP